MALKSGSSATAALAFSSLEKGEMLTFFYPISQNVLADLGAILGPLGAMLGPSWYHREPRQLVTRDIFRCRDVFIIGGTSLGQSGSLSGSHFGPAVEPLAALPLSPIRICGAMRTHIIEIQARMQIHTHKQKHMHTHIPVYTC